MENYQSTKDYFNNIADKWDSICYHDPNKIKAILTLAHLKKDSRILDIATGTGVLTPYLLDSQPKEICGIDLSELMIAQAKKNNPQPHVHFEIDNFYSYPGRDYDFAIAYSAYPHFENKKAFVKKLETILKPNGRFMIAHSESKETINHRHSGDQVQKVSSNLRDVEMEALYFKDAFEIDILVDTNELYIISGTKL
jgi:demethylmenaquinone methyltransferase/2-methoxy-6-polyprenyl-1,4-benzoquinol methylase